MITQFLRQLVSQADVHDNGERAHGKLERLLANVARYTITIGAFIVPLAIIPLTPDPFFVKVAVINVVALVSGVAWLLNAIVGRSISYRRTSLNVAFLALAVVLIASTFMAAMPWSSLWGPDASGEKTVTMLSFIIIAFVSAAMFERKDVLRLASSLAASLALVSLHALIAIAVGGFGWSAPSWLTVSPVGTVTTLAVVLAAGFFFAMGLKFSGARLGGTHGLVATVLLLMSVVTLFFIAFRAVWGGIAAASLFFIAYNIFRSWRADSIEDKEHISSTGLGVAFVVLAISLFLVWRPHAFANRFFRQPIEVTPSWQETLSIAKQAVRSNPLLGVGPADFVTAFSRHRSPTLNSTAFWQVKFTHGVSFISTVLITTGLLGLIALFALIAFALKLIAKSVSKSPSDAVLWAFGLASTFIMAEWFIYMPNITANAILFLSLGAVVALTAERRSIPIKAPVANLIKPLVVTFTVAASLGALWAISASYAAEIYARRAVEALNLYGNTDTAHVFFGRAASLNPTERAYHMGQAKVSLLSVNRIIGEAAQAPQDASLASRFQAEFIAGIQSGERAARLAPADPQPWLLLGQLYESVIPFVPGADRAASNSYEEVSKRDPIDPTAPLIQARAWLAAADVASLQASRTSGAEREQLDEAIKAALSNATGAASKSIGLKPDLADAHFISAQIALRHGNLANAIQNVSTVAALAPQDIGVAFQLGFLHYRAGDAGKAEAEFRRAIALNADYSNARYFLGIILDQRGDGAAALEQFQKVAELNSDNEEVKRIIANITSGRRALNGITPLPEERKEAPVKSTPSR